MASTFGLAPIPIWLIRLANGKPAARCGMYAYSSLDHQVFKPVFMDVTGTIPWPVNSQGGIDFRDNGTQGPFYWEDNGVDRYYLEFWTEGKDEFIDKIDHYPTTNVGPGPPITVINNLTNFIINGQFTFSDLINPFSFIPPGVTAITPIYNNLVPGGWFFFKEMVGNQDSLAVVEPSLSSTSPPSNPRGLLTYTCTVAGGGSRLDAMYITGDVKSFQNEQIQFQFQAMASGGAPIGVASEVIVYQFFGTGGAPSPTLITPFAFVWPTLFAPVSLSITVPSTAGKARGTNFDDYFAIGVRFPIGSIGIYQITNVMGVRGAVLPMNYIYDTQAETFYKLSRESAKKNIPTGTIRQSWDANAGDGWVLLQDGTTFGIDASTAVHKGFLYFNLFLFLWNTLPDSKAPVSGGRGVSAFADWTANKKIGVPLTTDCVFANASGSGTAPIATKLGAFTKVITASNLPALSVSIPFRLGAGSAIPGGAGPLEYTATSYPVLPAGTAVPFNVTQPTNLMYTFIKL